MTSMETMTAWTMNDMEGIPRMTQEEFFEYVYDTARADGDEVVCAEYNENSYSYFGVFNPEACYCSFKYSLYKINAAGDSVSLCEGTHQEWQTYRWPNASYTEYQDYVNNCG